LLSGEKKKEGKKKKYRETALQCVGRAAVCWPIIMPGLPGLLSAIIS
jgi:hypothetical protein